MLRLISCCLIALVAVGCSPSYEYLKVYGAKDGSLITTNGKPCVKNCGDIYIWENGKRVKVK